MSLKKFVNKFGSFDIERYPVLRNDSLQGFDSADEYVLNYISENNLLIENESKVLVLNDSFGAISISLGDFCKNVNSVTDSYQTEVATTKNSSLNNVTEGKIAISDSLFSEEKIIELSENNFVVIAVKIPKSSSMLEFQLQSIAALVEKSTNKKDVKIIGFGKAKNIHTSTVKLFEDIIGETKTSLAVKKSRLIFSEFSSNKSSYKSTDKFPVSYTIKNTNLFPDDAVKMINHCNLFSARKLDFGTAFLLENFPKLKISEEETCKIVDFGCGNGIISLFLSKKYYDNDLMKFTLIDESSMAIDSAKRSIEENEAEEIINERYKFLTDNSFDKLENDSVDYIVSNPPFHQEFAVNQEITQNMLEDAYRVLKTGGEVFIVANRHLQYHGKIQRVFGNYKNVAANPKFVILSAVKR